MDSFCDICVSDITIISGVRPNGRSASYTDGRSNNGILYIWNGEARFFTHDNQQIKGKTGELLFIPKGCKYEMQYTAPSTTFVLINLELFDKCGNDKVISENIEVIAKDDQINRIARIMANLELCGMAQSLCAVFRKKEFVYKLLGLIYESDSPLVFKHQKHPQIFAGVMMLEQTFLENIPISKFAQASNISVSLFRSLFNKQYDMTPVQYRNRLRIDRATAILSEGSCTVSEVAYACGFENVGYFCRYYKKITGKTPTQAKLGIFK